MKLKIRPHAKNFLLEAFKNYTLVLYTAGTQDYADKILTYLGIPQGMFKLRLYRDDCVKTINRVRKPLLLFSLLIFQRLTKDMRIFNLPKTQANLEKYGNFPYLFQHPKKIFLVDNSSYNYCNDLNQGIPVLSYFGESPLDKELKKLGDYLKCLAEADKIGLDIIQINRKQFNVEGMIKCAHLHEAIDIMLG